MERGDIEERKETKARGDRDGTKKRATLADQGRGEKSNYLTKEEKRKTNEQEKNKQNKEM